MPTPVDRETMPAPEPLDPSGSGTREVTGRHRAPPADSTPVVGAEPFPGRVVADKYRLDKLLRKGGMGSVWVATHLALGTPVAIKFMAAWLERRAAADSLFAAAQARFEREAKAAAQLRMANVVQILDYGIDAGFPYIVMELLEGEDLGARLARVGRLSLAEMRTILDPVSRALQRAHDAGLVHRDLKPENIFLAAEGDSMVPKILDFGVAKALHGDTRMVSDATDEGTVLGTPYYVSPEQATGRQDVDHRSDLWSIGVIAFQAITGQKPFKSDILLEAVVEICSSPIPQPTTIDGKLSRDVDVFFARALSRDREARFQSAKELANAFGDLVDRTTAAEQPFSLRRPLKMPPRNVLLGAAGALALLLGFLVVKGLSSGSASSAEGAPSASAEAAPAPPIASASTNPSPVIAPPEGSQASDVPPTASPSTPASIETPRRPSGGGRHGTQQGSRSRPGEPTKGADVLGY
jgi:serine/threonine-protein kinase